MSGQRPVQTRAADQSAQATGGPSSADSEAEFSPIFVVGCQRSGTTALAVMLDRHSRVAMLPETQFFCGYVPGVERAQAGWSHEQMVRHALDDPFIRESHLEADSVLAIFRRQPASHPHLFRAMLTAYAARHGKVRPAEKSCDHLRHIDRILSYYPSAKFICIVRDGRDVARSFKSSLRRGPGSSWQVTCRLWNASMRLARRWQRTMPDTAFTVVKYEDLILYPQRELRRLCDFIGERFEPTQLESGVSTDVVPDYEMAWKGKAKDAPDPTRVGAWRACEDRMHIAQLNYYMGPLLREWGYGDARAEGIGLVTRSWWWLRYLHCRRGIWPVAVRLNNLLGRERIIAPPPSSRLPKAQAKS